MSQLWFRILELLGRIRLRLPVLRRTRLRVGSPGALDARGSWGWRDYRSGERLFDVWGPVPEGPWVPFNCVPLFAALDRIRTDSVGPTPPEPDAEGAGLAGRRRLWLPAHLRPGARPPSWVGPSTLTMIDLPGPAAVGVAAWLVVSAGCQPVCTFDNWPHPRGLLKPEETLAELLRWATTIAEARQRLEPSAPPVWVCDSDRLGTRAGRPKEFDNRYYLDDSVLPAPNYLRSAGIGRIVYATMGGEEIPVVDLESYFAELLAAGLDVLHAQLMDPAGRLEPFAAPSRPRPPPRSGFRRSAAGGFGTEVPEPSSGGGG